MSAVPSEALRRPWRTAGRSPGRHPVARYAARRVAAGLLTLLVFSALVFFATSVLPGDAASAILGKRATGEQLAQLRHAMGIDQSLPQQYWSWLTGLLQGDLGNSAAGYAAGGDVSVASQIAGKLENSLVLAAIAFVPIVVLSLALGVATALRADRLFDHVTSAVTLLPAALPEFVFGSLLLAVFFSWLGVLPPVSNITPGVSPLAEPDKLVLPVLTLLGATVGAAVRMVRAGVIDTLAAEYVEAARLNGIGERRVVRRYVLRNALAPSVQVFALVAQYLVGGILVVEYLFAYPGIGKELIDAIAINDNLEVQSITMLLAAFVVAVTIVADLVVLALDPRLRT